MLIWLRNAAAAVRHWFTHEPCPHCQALGMECQACFLDRQW